MSLHESDLIGTWVKEEISSPDHSNKRKITAEEKEVIVLRKDDRYLYLRMVNGELTYSMDGGAFWFLIQEGPTHYLVVDNKPFYIISLNEDELILKKGESDDHLYFRKNNQINKTYEIMIADKYEMHKKKES